ncbi:uncharacterized protein LOC110453359 [Mizuhopecten yessoensis]|uniref:uncharacterized protein LOC110453359 n=1 Tax=Mizuhopecten yessoensis TaxID=6573 RepID=UPI000B45B3B9|nr:uncharacterized protein LOC110453359 [Mizuhopecten yessoensis]
MDRCTIHPGEKIQLVCKECEDKPVCNTCITTRHSGHSFRKYSKVKEEKLNEVREMKEENTRTKQKLELNLKKLRKEITRQNESKNRISREIENRTKELKRQIDKQGKQVEEKFRNQQEKHMAVLQKNNERLKREIKKCTQHDIELQRLLSAERISDLTTQLKLVTAPAADGIAVSDMSLSYKFVPGKCNPSLDMFGDIEKDTEDHYDIIGLPTHAAAVAQPTENDDGAYASMTPSRCSSVSLTSEAASIASLGENGRAETVNNRPSHPSTFSDRTRMKSVPRSNAAYIVLSANQDQCWVKCQDKDVVTLVNRFGKKEDTSIAFSDRIGGFSKYRSNELLVCLPEKKTIRLVDKYSAKDFINTAPSIPRCVQSGLFDGEIFAIVDDPGTSRVTTRSELVRYNNKGEEIRRIRKDKLGNDLFYSPDKISFNRTGTKMAVINPCGAESSHLLILNKNLEPLWRYFGDMRAVEGNTKFDPNLLQSDTNMCLSDVVFDNKDNVVIADKKTNTVKMLNQKMEPVRIVGTYTESPIALAMVHHNQTLWIKFDSGRLSVIDRNAPP